MSRLVWGGIAMLLCAAPIGACKRNAPAAEAETSRPGPAARIQESEALAAQRDAQREECAGHVNLYQGSITVDRADYQHPIARGDDYIDEPIPGLDRIVAKAPQLRFTLDYPFEKPFAGVVTGELTLRRIIDAIRAGFRKMYEGAKERDIPGMHNKDVAGPYGSAFHAIGDLVIESIDLCGDGTLVISIGS